MSTEIAEAVAVLKRAMAEDPDYARTWHDNAAICFYDSIPEGRLDDDHRIANEGAARFMKLAFEVETGMHGGYEPGQYEASVVNWDRFRGIDQHINLTVAFDILYPGAAQSPKYQYAIAMLAETQALQPIRSRQSAAVAIMHALLIVCNGKTDIAGYRRKW